MCIQNKFKCDNYSDSLLGVVCLCGAQGRPTMTGHTWEHLQPVTPTSGSLQVLPAVTVTLHRVHTHIMNLLHRDVGFCGQPQVLWLHINDHQHLGEKENVQKTAFQSRSRKQKYPSQLFPPQHQHKAAQRGNLRH